MTDRELQCGFVSQALGDRISLEALYDQFVQFHCAKSTETTAKSRKGPMEEQALVELEWRVRRVLKGNTKLEAYRTLILKHVATSIRGAAMETHKTQYTTALAEFAKAYPHRCVEAFFKEWRLQPGGKWWPTASDLIRDCESRLLQWKLRHKRVRDVMLKRGIETRND